MRRASLLFRLHDVAADLAATGDLVEENVGDDLGLEAWLGGGGEEFLEQVHDLVRFRCPCTCFERVICTLNARLTYVQRV